MIIESGFKHLFNPDPNRFQSWSNGGGTQSCAIAVLIMQGTLPKPDLAVMVNTERENSDVFEYQYKYVRPALEAFGIKCAYPNKSEYATVDLTSKNGKHILMPGFTDASGEVGKLTNYCTGEWKRRVIDRYLRSIGQTEVDQWLGMSVDEFRRIKLRDTKRERLFYPLAALNQTRQDCVALVLNFGWPKPPRSSCWMCPNKCNQEWREMKELRPNDFRRAVSLERYVRLKDQNFYLHSSCVTLDKVDLSEPVTGFDTGSCPSGVCFT